MNYIDVNEKQLYTSEQVKKYLNNLGYKSGKYIDLKVWKLTKYVNNTSIVRLSILHGIDIDYMIVKKNGKVRSWWYNPRQAVKLCMYYDEWIEKNNIKYGFCTDKIIKLFWKTHILEDILNKDNFWYFERMYFFIQTSEVRFYMYNRNRFNIKDEYIKALINKDYRYIPLCVNKNTLKETARILFSKKQFGNLFDRHVIRGCL